MKLGRHSTKDTVDGTRNLDVLYFQQRGLFSWTPRFTYTMSWRLGEEIVSSISYALVGPCGSLTALRLKYSAIHWEEKSPCEYQVGLTSTSCNYGGFRYWFLCPLWKSGLPCNRRCRFLYLPSGNNYFGCRKCYELAYESSRRFLNNWKAH